MNAANYRSDQSEVLDMVVRLKQAADQREAGQLTSSEQLSAGEGLDFPAEFFQYFTFVRAA